MSYYKTCPHCGANLDPGEVCDCREKEKAPASATNTDRGGVDKALTGPDSTSHDNRK